MSDVLLRARSIHKSYPMGRERLVVLKGASLSADRGEFVAIMGASGSGKSTLLHILGALDVPDRGHVSFEGHDVFSGRAAERDRLRNQAFGFVFQFYYLLPELTVMENVVLPAMVGSSVLGWFGRRKAVRAAAAETLEMVGLSQRLRHRPNELSGGERQRVAIARALINRPAVLLVDEPTGNLDAAMGREILAVFARLNERGQTIVMVTHDANVAAAAHRVVTLEGGKVRAKVPEPLVEAVDRGAE